MKKRLIRRRIAGQSLMEIIVGAAIGALVIGSAAGAVVLTLKSNFYNRTAGTATSLLQESVDNIKIVAGGKWQDLYNLSPKGTSTHYKIGDFDADGDLEIQSGDEVLSPINNITYTRYFTVENVNRTSCGRGNITTASAESCSTGNEVVEDPSTQKVTSKITWPQGGNLESIEYLTRIKNNITGFSDWNGNAVDPPEVVTSPSKNYNSKTSNVDVSSTGEIKLSE